MRLALFVTLGCALVAAAGAAAFAPSDPLSSRQWYLQQNRAFDYWTSAADADLAPVRVAVIDSGIDGGHPDLVGKVVAARSFVGGSPYRDTKGHGTFVAGLIAATLDNGEGIAGMAFNARLVVAKVVTPSGAVPLRAEVAAIRWAAAPTGIPDSFRRSTRARGSARATSPSWTSSLQLESAMNSSVTNWVCCKN